LLSEGARDWPYQVIDVSIFNTSEAALRPPGFNPALEGGLSNAKANCLTCHKVNGFGGEKVEGNLALVARQLPAAEFIKWTLEPSVVRPDTTMPALLTNLGEVERRAIAQSIYEYLSQVPVAPEPEP
jgi:mono/diheme cytochrome c family protein